MVSNVFKALGGDCSVCGGQFRAEYCCQIFGAASEKANALLNFPEQGTLDRKYSTPEYTVHHVNVDPNVIYYMVYPDAIVIGVIVHQKQSPKTVNEVLKHFFAVKV